MVSYRVRMSDRFLESAVLAAIEAYCYGTPDDTAVETLGPIWGFRRRYEDEEIIFLDRVAVSISAERRSSWVRPRQEATILMTGVMERLAPEMTLLGSFHSHPYNDRREVASVTGYEFSEGDFRFFLTDEYLWSHNPLGPVMVVITICRLERVHDSDARKVRPNVTQFDIGQFRFWINVVAGYFDANGEPRCTRNKYSPVWVDLNSRFFNYSGDRVGDVPMI